MSNSFYNQLPESYLEDRLLAARAAIDASELHRADLIYRELAATGVADPRPYCNLGVLALMQNCASEAISWLRQALVQDPDHARSHLNLGQALNLDKRPQEAMTAFRLALSLDPQLAEAWNNLGFMLAGEGKLEQAMAAYHQALSIRSDYVQAATNLSNVLFSLAETLRLQGRLDEAIASYEECLCWVGGDQNLVLPVAQGLILCGQADQALVTLLPQLAMCPDDSELLSLVGSALQELGEFGQAIEHYHRAVQLDPAQLNAHIQLGLCYSMLGLQSKAIRQLQAGLAIAPTNLGLRCNLAVALRCQGYLDASMAELEQVLQQEPEQQQALMIQLFNCSISSEQLSPLALDLSQRFWRGVRRPGPSLGVPAADNLGPLGDQPCSLQQGQIALAASCSQGDLALPMAPADDRIRIGFLSAEIGNHVVGTFLSSFLAHYDRNRFAVELFVSNRRFEANATTMADQVDHHWMLHGMEIGPARALLRSRRIDVLVDTTGFTANTAIALLAERCAPIQCHYIGYHATTGLDTIDWFIGDDETLPEAFASQFVEGLWRLPRPWLARAPNPNLPLATSTTSEPGPVLGCFNQLVKLSQETLAYWAAALQAVPASRLVIKDRSTVDAEACARISGYLAGLGVAPERISYCGYRGSWMEHMADYNGIDLALDATPWSSATTGFDALEMGVPLVAIRGRCTSARMSAAILRGLGRPEWIADSPNRFAAIVADLCADLARLRAGKPILRQQVQSSPLFDGADLSRCLQQAFIAMLASASARSCKV